MFLKTICTAVLNLERGDIALKKWQIQALNNHRKGITTLISRTFSLNLKSKILNQNGAAFNIFPIRPSTHWLHSAQNSSQSIDIDAMTTDHSDPTMKKMTLVEQTCWTVSVKSKGLKRSTKKNSPQWLRLEQRLRKHSAIASSPTGRGWTSWKVRYRNRASSETPFDWKRLTLWWRVGPHRPRSFWSHLNLQCSQRWIFRRIARRNWIISSCSYRRTPPHRQQRAEGVGSWWQNYRRIKFRWPPSEYLCPKLYVSSQWYSWHLTSTLKG